MYTCISDDISVSGRRWSVVSVSNVSPETWSAQPLSVFFFSVSRLSNTSMMKFGQRANESLLSILSYRASLFLKLFAWRNICTHIVLQRLRTSAVLDMCLQSPNRTFQFLYVRSYGGLNFSESFRDCTRFLAVLWEGSLGFAFTPSTASTAQALASPPDELLSGSDPFSCL